MSTPDRTEMTKPDIQDDPERDPVAALEWLAGEAEACMDPVLTPAWARVLREAAKRWSVSE